ncbi:uncharacterized protein LOC116221151 isoform X3 [Clupea harengus]|uniref:Uncharacterized protein LOC116221151 isoform X3 n=1 Tax=Clupea harengus TaxID=7950 RepID=A0A6P8FL37_CLUHA|nr:uncharacterized protein LOC116221151 isoform X3 [Clupea harengus]
MSLEVDVGSKLFFEGYLKKRKDKMKIRWVTYWFRLHNTTLFFYSKKEGRATNLKGQYYIYTVQSVREVTDGKRHTFEITMKNGKRKVLAADTAELRWEWVRQLWKSMQLSGSGRSLSVCPRPKGTDQKARSNSSPCTSDMLVTKLVEGTGQPSHGPSGPDDGVYTNWLSSHRPNPTDNTTFSGVDTYSQVTFKTEYNQIQERKQKHEDILYDVLPPARKSMPLIENIYDTPTPYRRVSGQQQPHTEVTDGIYDVPKSLLSKMSEHTLEN